ncbi:MAG TPA: hypothetical protein VJT11_12890 [Nitrospiraceae bacterium]|nr:hypothetical protein [Nitrospiraceae bacterium]
MAFTNDHTIGTTDKNAGETAEFVQCALSPYGGTMIPTEMQQALTRKPAIPEFPTTPGRLEEVVSTAEEFDRVVSQTLPILLDRATAYTKRFLRETGQWNDDIAHEKFVLRWGAEYLERFLVCGPSEVPCRPLFLLESLVAKHHSRPEPFCYHSDLLTPLGRFLDGLMARAAISRDALIALYRHCYGLGPGEVIAAIGLNGSESPRIYKNFRRWRDSGWQRTMDEMGISDVELEDLLGQQQRSPQRFNNEAEHILRSAQAHYRKSEPDHYPCRSLSQWEEMFSQGYGCDYRIWHLALCLDCMQATWGLGSNGTVTFEKPKVKLQVRP